MNERKKLSNLICPVCRIMAFTLMCLYSHRGDSQILVGPVAGAQLNWVTFEDKDNRDLYRSDPSPGYHFGGSISFRMSKRVFLQSSLLYSRKTKSLVGRDDPMFSNKLHYHYIDMPISFTKEVKMQLGKGKYYNLYFGVGPTISYWLGGKGRLTSSDLNENGVNPPNYDLNYKIKFDGPEENTDKNTLNIPNPNRLQLGLNFSAGIVLEPAGFNKIMVTARYEWGHSYFSKDHDGNFGLPGKLFYIEDLQSRMQGAAISAFYFIDLKTSERKKGKSTVKVKQKRRR